MTRLISLVTISIAAINAQNAVTQAPLNQRKIIEIDLHSIWLKIGMHHR